MKVAVGIPTYNRADMVRINARYLSRSRLTSDITLFVVDDASTEYDVVFLREVYPAGTDIQRRDQNSGGADFAAYDLLNRLVATEADVLVLLDSDLIVSREFMVKTLELLPLAKGILSLFNTPAHAAVGSHGPFLLKKTVGAAGTVWPRRLAVETLAGVPPGWDWDWRFSDFLSRRSRNQKGVRRLSNNHPRLSGQFWMIRRFTSAQIVPANAGARVRTHWVQAITARPLCQKIFPPQRQFAPKMSRVSP